MGGATCQPLNQNKAGLAPVNGTVKSISDDGWFNVRNTALMQRFKITGLSEFETTGLETQMDYAGDR